MTSFDPRLTPARRDVAAEALRGEVAAERYAKGTLRSVAVPSAPLRRTPDQDTGMASELLYGEEFVVYDQADGWAWGQSTGDSYVGYVRTDLLGNGVKPTHWLAVPASHRYPSADLKRPPAHPLYFASLLEVADTTPVKGFLPLTGGGFVPARHVRAIGDWLPDFIETAMGFMGMPYLWGGRTAAGLDCSGLIQLALMAAGRPCLRDSDMQAATLGEEVAKGAPLKRGDVVCFPGHIGFMVDDTRLLHANATWMAVTLNPLSEVIAIVLNEKPDAWVKVRRLV